MKDTGGEGERQIEDVGVLRRFIAASAESDSAELLTALDRLEALIRKLQTENQRLREAASKVLDYGKVNERIKALAELRAALRGGTE